ncbi:MAG: NUDIX domain-containing protein [Clostridia bacterium]|nr:NUDIX domain-containing protein [Clostridia bacterium]
MRAPFQILALPYRKRGEAWEFCVFHRTEPDEWQFASGGGEDDETPDQAALREIWEETGFRAEHLTRLSSVSAVPANVFREDARAHWPMDTYVVPEYHFAYECTQEIVLSHEHRECVWLTYPDAQRRLKWDSNKTALYELWCILNGRLEKTLVE